MGRTRNLLQNQVAQSSFPVSGQTFFGDGGSWRSVTMICIALIVVTVSVYWQVGTHEFLNYDDADYVTQNYHVAEGITGSNVIWAFTSVHAANWHPITWLSHMLDAQIYGMNPRGHHLSNVLIHAVSAALVFLLLFQLTNSFWPSSFAAVLFAIHPLHVESVAWVAERKDVLGAFFWFLTLIAYAAYVANRKRPLYFLALFLFMLGLMSKPMLVTLPVIMLLLDFWPLKRLFTYEGGTEGFDGDLGKSSLIPILKEKIPFFVCSLFSAIVTIYAQREGGAVNSLADTSLWLRIENSITAYVKYILMTLWPKDLAVIYPFPLQIQLWQVICSLLVLLLISAAAMRYGKRHPYLPVGWLWFLITLLPVIGLVKVGEQSLADRYTYIPHIGLFIMAAWGISDLAKGLPLRRIILTVTAGMVIIALTVLTWIQLGYWKDNISLFQHAIQVTTGNYVAHYSLGLALVNKGDVDAGIREYKEALAIYPDDFEVHDGLGVVFAKQGDLDGAIKEFQTAIAINPKGFEAHNNLGLALIKKGEMNQAIKEYQKSIEINPNYFNSHYNLSLALNDAGDLDAAVRECRNALAMKPNDFKTLYTLGSVLFKKGDLDAAIEEYKKTTAVNPVFSDAYYNLGLIYTKKGYLDAAIGEYRKVLTINPNDSGARNNLEMVLSQKKGQSPALH